MASGAAEVQYDDDATLREARGRYFEANGLGDGGYGERWVKLELGPVPLAFPNSDARRRAVRFHDLHHVLTAYGTSWLGEAEIGAWEVASGCAHHYVAWLLNLQAMVIGLAIDPAALFRAFVRGRRSRNLYREAFGDALLDQRVGATRRQLGLPADAPAATARDRLHFALWLGVALVTTAASLAVLLAPLVLLLAWIAA
jgi:hypothetical protein